MSQPLRKDRTDPGGKALREPRHLIGTAFRRVDGRAKVTGVTRFADDLVFPRMCFLRLVRSTVPHARIGRIDFSAAEKVPGYLGRLTGEAMPIPFGILPVSQDEHALCPDVVRFVGDPVAAVAAATEDAAWEAALAVAVDYEPLETIASVEEALATPEPRLHDYGDHGNVHKAVAFEFGDVEAGFAAAERVFEDLLFYDGSNHLAMEQHAAVAVPEDEGRVTLYSATQTPHYVHRATAKVLDLPASRIRVVACSNGGGFGGKSDPFSHEIVAAKMALVLGRPVKVTLTREEVFYCHRGRHPVLMHLKTGLARREGRWRITAQHLKTALDGGAYGSYGVASTYYTGALQTVAYDLPKYRFEGVRCFTNKPPCGPKRGHGTPQPRFGFEVHLDKIAGALGEDPADLRLGMLAAAGSVTANWLQIGSMGLGRCLEAVVEGSGWRERRGRLPYGRGLGLACGSYLCGAGLPIYWNHMPQSGVQLRLDRSGGVAVFCGEAEIGQGSDSVLAAVVAAETRHGTLGTVGSYVPPRSPGRYRGAGVGPSPAYSYTACVVEVEVDPETGIYRPLHVWIAHDVGRAINPVLVLGQIEGSVYMALGEAMMEEQAFRRLPPRLSSSLVHKMPSLLEYKSPTFLEMPPVTSYLIEEPDPEGPFGAKEVGQGPLLPVLPALANALHDAVGVRIDQVPIHPDMVLKAITAGRQGAPARYGPRSFPEVDFGAPLKVPTPEEGGDGTAINDYRSRLRGGMRAAGGTMPDRRP